MTLMSDIFSPLNALLDLHRRVNRLFESGRGERPSLWTTFPPVNLSEEEDKFVLTVEAPGVDPKAIELTVLDDTVAIKGARKPTLEDRARYIWQERICGDFSRTVALPGKVAADGIEATFANGILTVNMPKAPETRPKQITIKVG